MFYAIQLFPDMQVSIIQPILDIDLESENMENCGNFWLGNNLFPLSISLFWIGYDDKQL